MNELLKAFKNHWFISMFGICVVVAGATWKVASEVIERPLKNQVIDADRQTSIWKDQVSIAEKQLAQARTIPSPSISISEQAGNQVKEDSGFTSGACEILEAGNKLYDQRNFLDAIEKYLNVQTVDKLGKSLCVASIYATMGTIYTLLAEPQLVSNPSEAAKNFRLASRYNRAFAAAAICNHGECKLSQALWAEGF